MIASDSNVRLIQILASELTPVRRLAPPILRVTVWVSFVTAIAIALAASGDFGPMVGRFRAAPDLCVAAIGSMLTAVLAAAAAFQLSLPDRKPIWALLPVPAGLLWIGASGIGCLRRWAVADIAPLSLFGTDGCLLFILGLSTPLSIFLMVMLRPGCSLRPNLTSTVCGLACAAAAATLLNLIHSHDATAADLAIHVLAVGVVIASNRILGVPVLKAKNFWLGRNNAHAGLESMMRRSSTEFSSPQNRSTDAESGAADSRPVVRTPPRTDHHGNVVRFHRSGGDGSGRDQSCGA